MRNVENAIKKVAKHQGPLTRAIVVYTAKQTFNQYNRGWIKPKSTEAIEAIDSLGLREFLETPLVGRVLADDLTKIGVEWLNKMLFTSKGKERDTKYTRGAFGPHRYNAFAIVKNFSHFTFDGFESDGYGNVEPRWRVHAKDGQSFSYVCTLGAHNYNGYFSCGR